MATFYAANVTVGKSDLIGVTPSPLNLAGFNCLCCCSAVAKVSNSGWPNPYFSGYFHEICVFHDKDQLTLTIH